MRERCPVVYKALISCLCLPKRIRALLFLGDSSGEAASEFTNSAAPGSGGFLEPAGDPSLPITVPYTTPEGTLAALKASAACWPEIWTSRSD